MPNPSALIDGNALALALAPEGLLPKECRLIELHMPIDGALYFRYEVNILQEDIPKIIRALQRIHDDGRAKEVEGRRIEEKEKEVLDVAEDILRRWDGEV